MSDEIIRNFQPLIGKLKRHNVSCRAVLYWMILTGTCLSHMLKAVQNIVIPGIVEHPSKPPSEVQCKISNSTNQTPIVHDDSINSTIVHKFTWSEYQQGLMLSSYYWLHPFMELVGGVLTRKYGPKFVCGMGLLLSTLLGYSLPSATKYHPYTNIFIRVLQGTAAGVAYPSTHSLTAKWIPQNERSKFMSAYLGSVLAVMVTYVISGHLIEYLSWEAIYYIISSIGLLWCIFWFFLVYDSPVQHPRITKKEKRYILDNIGESTKVHHKKTSIPWKKIFTSVPLWAVIMANSGGGWGNNILAIQGPNYLTSVHGWNIKKIGVLAGFPFFLNFIFAVFSGRLIDWLINSKKMNRTNARKLATFLHTGGSGLMSIGMAYSGCSSNLAFTFMCFGAALLGGISSGSWANYIDLSPNYASVIFGFSGLLVNCTGFISPIFVGLLTDKNQTIHQWKIIFLTTASIQWTGFIIYLIWGSGEEQAWNNEELESDDDNKTERIKLRNPTIISPT